MEHVLEKATEIGLKNAGILPMEKDVMTCNMEGKPPLDLPDESPSCLAVEKIVHKIGLDTLR